MPSLEDNFNRASTRLGTMLKAKWRLDTVLGVGGMASVYAATHRNKKRAAIKMLHPELSADVGVRQRFLREGYAANSVDHPGTVTVLDDDVAEDGSAFLVMELLEGETLEARRDRKGGSLPAAEVLSLMCQVLDVLASAHAKGMVHRDIKPDNLFLTHEGRMKVLDFGIAHLKELAPTTGQGQQGTQAGSLLGTPGFMSPEQARARWDLVDQRTDIWAVGATMYTLLAACPVHDGVTLNEQLIKVATESAPSLGEVTSGLPSSVIEIVDRALAFDRDQRWSNATAMRSALRTALEDVMPDGPVSILVGSERRFGREQEPTLAAPETPFAGEIPASSEQGNAPFITAHSRDSSVRPPPSRLRSGLVGAGVTAAILALIAFVATRNLHEHGEALAAHGIDKPIETQVVPTVVAPPPATAETADPPTIATVDASAPIASVDKHPITAHPPATTTAHPTTNPVTTTAVPKPPTTTVTPPPATTAANPFDRRH